MEGEDDKRIHLSLLCVGELGRQIDLGQDADPVMLKDLIVSCFDSTFEATKSAAAYALGHLAVGESIKLRFYKIKIRFYKRKIRFFTIFENIVKCSKIFENILRYFFFYFFLLYCIFLIFSVFYFLFFLRQYVSFPASCTGIDWNEQTSVLTLGSTKRNYSCARYPGSRF